MESGFVATISGKYMTRKIVKVCLHGDCCRNGSWDVLDTLENDRELRNEADVSGTPDCFHFCKKGPNVAVDGNVLHFVRPGEALRRVRSEIDRPSPRRDVLGSRPIDELDDVLDDLTRL